MLERHVNGQTGRAMGAALFTVYRSQPSVIKQAVETAASMLRSDKSRGYMLEMTCADFLAGANVDRGNPDALMAPLDRLALPCEATEVPQQS
jgi:hypothetical protein